MPSANDMQVGGSHYDSTNDYKHWDWVLDMRLGYLEGQVTKYVLRWRGKAGLQDLQKALHYNTKLMENWRRLARTVIPAPDVVRACTSRLAAGTNMLPEEIDICSVMAGWQTNLDLMDVHDMITHLMEQVDATDAPEPVLADPEPVPLEDSNKHADRYRGGE
jgi:hypothetical protein